MRYNILGTYWRTTVKRNTGHNGNKYTQFCTYVYIGTHTFNRKAEIQQSKRCSFNKLTMEIEMRALNGTPIVRNKKLKLDQRLRY